MVAHTEKMCGFTSWWSNLSAICSNKNHFGCKYTKKNYNSGVSKFLFFLNFLLNVVDSRFYEVFSPNKKFIKLISIDLNIFLLNRINTIKLYQTKE